MSKKNISIIISFRNEQENIPELLKRIKNITHNSNYTFEIVFIDDCSTDNSFNITKNIYQNTKLNIQYYKTIKRLGGQRSLLAAFEIINSDACIYFDADLQDPPELIEKLLVEWEKGSLIVHTVRIKRKKETIIKKVLSSFAYILIDIMNKSMRDAGDYKLLDKSIYKFVSSISDKNPYLKGFLSNLNVQNSQVKYVREGRFSGETKYPLINSTNPYNEFLKGIFVESREKLPALLLVKGFLIFLLSLVILLIDYIFNLKFFHNLTHLFFYYYFSLVLIFLFFFILRIHDNNYFKNLKYFLKKQDL